MGKPRIAITMGDPAGIGPEIIVKVLSIMETYDICQPLVVGSKEIIKDAVRMTHRALKINVVKEPNDGKYRYGVLDLLDLDNIKIKDVEYGKVSAKCGKAAGEVIAKAIELAKNGAVDAVVTAPINKESFKLGGWGNKYVGHTEMFADLTDTKKYTMMLAHNDFRVVHVSTHVPLAEAVKLVKKDRILEVIKIAYNACLSLGVEKPRVAVAGLNPHAGDGGVLGREEIDEILPAIEEAQNLGIDADGPIPADTVFSKAVGGWYDIVVTMYHDQGHIPMKTVGFVWDESRKDWKAVSGINATLGLPIIRVSVDHGTAFGKAGKGTARPDSLIDAIELAVRMAQNG